MKTTTRQTDKSLGNTVFWCRILAVVCVLLTSLNGWLLMQSNKRNDIAGTLTARELRIVDDAGDLVVHLVGNTEEVGVFLKDRWQRDRIALTHDEEQTGLFIKDSDGDSRIGIAQFSHGGGGVALHGKDLKGSTVLYYKNTGSLSFFTPEGQLSDRLPPPASPEINAAPQN